MPTPEEIAKKKEKEGKNFEDDKYKYVKDEKGDYQIFNKEDDETPIGKVSKDDKKDYEDLETARKEKTMKEQTLRLLIRKLLFEIVGRK